MKRVILSIFALVVAVVAVQGVKAAGMNVENVVLGQFSPGLGQLVGAGFDPTTDRVWVYGNFNDEMQSYTATGDLRSSIARPGEKADDADILFAPEVLTISSTVVTTGTLLFINGETDETEIYALNKTTGAISATLATKFGNSHVVGGAYHAARNTFFLVQDRQPSGSVSDSLIAEIDPITGDVLNSFQIASVFSVNYGDIEVDINTGHLIVVSNDEGRIAEFTPTGTLVQYHTLPSGVSSLSGIAFDEARDELWLSGTGGKVWRLGVFLGGSFTSPDSKTTFQFRSGSFVGSVTISYTVLSSVPAFGSLRSINRVYEATPILISDGTLVQPIKPYLVVILYTEADLSGVDESTLGLYFYDGTNWVLEPTSQVDAATNSISAQPSHFSTWAVLSNQQAIYLPLVNR